jgi:hypothetical protein
MVCHCIPCRKTAGANGSYNYAVKEDQVRAHGESWCSPPQMKMTALPEYT